MTDPNTALVNVGPAVEEAPGVWRAPAPPPDLVFGDDPAEDNA